MDRRTFLVAGAALASRLRRAQRTGTRNAAPLRAAVVIGVDKPGDLPPLSAAAKGARDVADWLKQEQFEVTLFDDSVAPVTTAAVFAAIDGLVRRGTLDQLVVYFAGHGFISGALSEFWLLSGAPNNPNEAVSLTESAKLAELTGIRNVVFISDACRSLPDSLGAQRITGSVIFPNRNRPSNAQTDVDQFLATRIGAAAFEGKPVAEASSAYAGVFTTCFLEAFQHPYPEMVYALDGTNVVPNRRLRTYLSTEVPKRAALLSPNIVQHPDSKVYSDEPTYISRVVARQVANPPAARAGVADVALTALWGARAGGGRGAGNGVFSTADLAVAADKTGFNAASREVTGVWPLAEAFTERSGFVVRGAKVVRASVTPGNAVQLDINPTEGTRHVPVDVSRTRGCSVALSFEDGSGTVLAALDGYVGQVFVDRGVVSSVNYIPTRRGEHWGEFNAERKRLEEYHALVATAARFGVLRFDGPRRERERQAAELAGKIRMLKGIDPTLGIYAASAYADAGLTNHVMSVRGAAKLTLNVELFDIVMLSRALPPERPMVPCCPMFSQNWALLRALGVELWGPIAELKSNLAVSLWLTFDSQAMAQVHRYLPQLPPNIRLG